MVVRRIRQHVAAHNWFAVGIDLAIVVLGVFLGLQAANWNQARIERAEAADYRLQLIANLRANEADVAARKAYYQQVRAHAVAALDAMQRPDGALGERFLIDAYQASQGWFRPLQRTAYDEPVESSVKRKIGDTETRSQLSAYYQLASGFDALALSVTAYRERLRRAMDLHVQLAIRRNCNDIMLDLPDGGQAPALPATCSLGLDPPDMERAARQLAAVSELDQDLTRLIGDIDQKLGQFDRASRDAARLRARLEAI